MASDNIKETNADEKTSSSCCSPKDKENVVVRENVEMKSKTSTFQWINGLVTTKAGFFPKISTKLTNKDRYEHFLCRISSFRNNYKVAPGLYAVGSPGDTSEVFVTANYKMSFDSLRSALDGMDAWVLVLDTRGINVWCAAGKGTFGAEELLRRIDSSGLNKVVTHRKLILPQLGAVGVSAHEVKEQSGFKVIYGPVSSDGIKGFVDSGLKCTKADRRVRFNLWDRLVLIPMELNPTFKAFAIYIFITFMFFLITPDGFTFRGALSEALPFVLLGAAAILSGALLTPLLLPIIPFRGFSIKGFIISVLTVALLVLFVPYFNSQPIILKIFSFVFFPAVGSYLSLQFTGSTTYTGMSGVRREMRFAVPVYIAAVICSVFILIFHKVIEWGFIL